MSGGDHIESELESFLKEDGSRIAALYRKLPRAEPDAKLDAAVLARARAAVAAKPARRHWMPALGAAAVVLFAAGLAYRTAPQVWNEPSELAKQSAAQTVELKKPVAPSESGSAPQSASTPASPAPRDAEAFPSNSAVNMAKPKMVPPLQDSSDAMMRQKSVSGTIAPQPMTVRPTADRARADKAFSVAAPAAMSAPPPQSAPLQSPTAQENAKREIDVQPSKAQGGAGRGESVGDALTAGAASPPTSPEPSSHAAGAAAISARSAADSNANLYPEHWLENIRHLLRDHRRDDAVRSLGEFRKKYPDYRLPDDLRDMK